MTKTKKYKKPPLTEAVFELFYRTDNWTPATPGQFYSQVKEKYPVISQSSGGFGVSFAANGIQIGPGNNNITRYSSENSQSIIQITNNLLTVNKLPMYEGWESYKGMIIDAVSAFVQVMDVKTISRIGLRTINKIDIQAHSYENFKKYFNVYPNIGSGLRKNGINSIQLNYQTLEVEETEEVLAVNLSTLRKEEKYNAPTLFEIYYTRMKEIETKGIDDWLEIAHQQLHVAFESILTNECKQNFDND